MKKTKEVSDKINWLRFTNIILSCFLSALCGIGLEDVIAKVNNSVTYGHYASYVVTAFLVVTFNLNYLKLSKGEK